MGFAGREIPSSGHRFASSRADGTGRDKANILKTNMASRKRRILVTGVARWWGALLVQRLVEDPDVAEVIGIDTREPRYDLGRADYLKLDIRHSLIGQLVRSSGIDNVRTPSTRHH